MLEAWVFAVTVLLRLNPPDVLIYPESGERIESPDRLAAESACSYLRAVGVPLPVPYAIQPFKAAGEGRSQVPDTARRVSGMLNSCPEDTTAATIQNRTR
jgi:hypothetical protein